MCSVSMKRTWQPCISVLSVIPNCIIMIWRRSTTMPSWPSNPYTFLTIQPEHFEAHLGLAHTLQKLGRKTDTFDELNRIVQLFPDSAEAYAARAVYEAECKLYDAAVYDWDEALRLQPDNVEYAVSKVDVLIRQGRRREARDVLDALVRRGTSREALKEWYDQLK